MFRRPLLVLVMATLLLAVPVQASPPPYSSARESESTTLDLLGGESSGNAEASAQTGEFFLYSRTSSNASTGLIFPPVSVGANRATAMVELVKRDQGGVASGMHQVNVQVDLSRVRTQASGNSSSSLYVNVISYASYCDPACGTNSAPLAQEYLGCSWTSSYCLPKNTMTVKTQVDCPGVCTAMTTYVWIYSTAHSYGEAGSAESIGEGTVTRVDH